MRIGETIYAKGKRKDIENKEKEIIVGELIWQNIINSKYENKTNGIQQHLLMFWENDYIICYIIEKFWV